MSRIHVQRPFALYVSLNEVHFCKTAYQLPLFTIKQSSQLKKIVEILSLFRNGNVTLKTCVPNRGATFVTLVVLTTLTVRSAFL